jgi:hypothetical protein
VPRLEPRPFEIGAISNAFRSSDVRSVVPDIDHILREQRQHSEAPNGKLHPLDLITQLTLERASNERR